MSKVKIQFVILIMIFSISVFAADVNTTRDLPACYNSDSNISVNVLINVPDSGWKPNGVIIKEFIPSGWIVNPADTKPPANSFDASAGELKWVLFGTDVIDKTISYTCAVPKGENGENKIEGQILYIDKSSVEQTITTLGKTSFSDCPIQATANTQGVAGSKILSAAPMPVLTPVPTPSPVPVNTQADAPVK